MYSAILRHFKFFSKTLYRQGLHSIINLRYFKVFTGTSSIRGQPVPVYTSKHFKGLLFSKPNALFASKHFLVFFICPILLKLGMEEKDPSIKVRTKKRKMFSGIWRSSVLNVSKQKLLTPTNATLLGWTKSFLFRLRLRIFVVF